MAKPKKVLTIEVYRHSNDGGYSIFKINHETFVEIGGGATPETVKQIDEMLKDMS